MILLILWISNRHRSCIKKASKLDILKETCKFTDGKHIFEGTFIDALQYIKTQYKKGVPKLEELKKEVV